MAAGHAILVVTLALLVGLGGREMGGELAAGRHLSRIVAVGDRVEVDGIVGRIVALHPASVEIDLDGASLHVANTRLTRGDLRVHHD